jgi:hypothetical protein
MDAMQVNHPAGDICELDTWQHRPDEREPDAEFIAASRTLVPTLIVDVERLRAENAELEATVDELNARIGGLT